MADKYTLSKELRRVADLLESQESLLEEIERLANIGHWDWNIKNNTLYWSSEIYNIFGLDEKSFKATYEAFAERIHPEDRLAVQEAVESATEDGIPYHVTHRITRPNGEVRWVEENGEVDINNGVPTRMIGTIKDITTERAHTVQTERFSKILQTSFEEIYMFDATTYKFKEVSKGVLNNLGYSLREIKQLTPYHIKPEFTFETFNDYVEPLRTGKVELLKFEATHRRKDGSMYNVDVRLQYTGGDDPMFISLVSDITERKRHEEELKTLAFRDPGTNLYNKRFFQEQLEVSVNRADRDHAEFALILVDLDDFSDVNNKYGHIAGDALIKEIASRIDGVFTRRGDITARYGGDEFTVLCYNMGPEMVGHKCQQLVEEIAKHFVYEETLIPHSASVGLCYYDGKEETTCQELLECADKAMYAAKHAGKNQYKAYHEIK